MTVTDALGRSTTQVASAWGSVAQVIDAAGSDTDYEYDAFGNLLRTRDIAGNEVVLGYNVRGMKTSASDPDLASWSYVHNALGEVISQSDAKGQTASFTYDALSRPLSRRTELEGTTTWTYGTLAAARDIGRLQAVSSPGYAESYGYDQFGRDSQRSITIDGATHFIDVGYNSSTGLVETLTYPASTAGYRLKLLYEYAYGIPQRVADFNAPATTFWRAYATDARGQVIDEALGNGFRTLRGFDQVTGTLDYIQTSLGGSAIQNLSYQWSRVGTLLQRQDVRQSLTEAFQYDSLDRLDYSTLNGATNLDLSYDALGNITYKSNVGTGAWTYDPVKKHAVRTAGAYTFSYDNNGNMTDNAAGDSGTWTSYNLPSLIQGSSATGTSSSRFFHGPDRQRYKQEAVYGPMAQTTRYLGGLVEQVSAGATTQWKHAILTPVGVVGLHSRSSDGTNETLYFTKDHLGSVDTISNTAGSVLIRLSYDAFGKRRKEAGWSGSVSSAEHQTINATSHRGYTGHEMLDHLGLIHMNGRVYHAEIGRFLSADPYIDGALNTQGWNRYAYVKNSPLSFVDPTGFCDSSVGPMGPKGPEAKISSTCSAWLSGMAYALYVFDTITHSRPSLSGCIGCPRTPLDHLDDDNGTTPSAGGGTISPYTPLFRDNFAGHVLASHVLASFDNMAGLIASPFRDGPTRGLFSNIVLSPRELQDTKFSLVVSAAGPLIGGTANGTRAIAAGATTSAVELIPTHGMTLSRRAFEVLKQDISLNGIKSPINFVEVNGRKYVLDGHHRLRAARELGIQDVPTEQVQLPFLGYKTIDDLFGGF